jgi:prepilin-type processing-associated H-X9-DG protein
VKHAPAFTLVEALVSVAIIALLLGLLAPTLGASRDAARAMVCAAAARELQGANLAFGVDHDDAFVPGARRIESENLERWHGRRDAIGEAFRPERGPLTPYLGGAGTSDAVRACSEFVSDLDVAPRGGFERGGGGYGYNNAFVGVKRREGRHGAWTLVTNEEGSPMSRFARPDTTVAFADSAFAADAGLVEYSFAEPAEWPDYPGARPDPSIHFRHRGRASIAWLDGHVSSEERVFSAWSELFLTNPETSDLGWFGAPEAGNAHFDYD